MAALLPSADGGMVLRCLQLQTTGHFDCPACAVSGQQPTPLGNSSLRVLDSQLATKPQKLQGKLDFRSSAL